MAPSACDQKKAEIVRHAEIQCSAEVNQAKATYELKCLELKKSYEARKNQACRDLEQQELEELGEIKRLYEVELEPIKAKHAEKLSAIRERYRIAAPETGLDASAISETPSSPTLVVVSVSHTPQNRGASVCKEPNVQFFSSDLPISNRLRLATRILSQVTDPLTIPRNLGTRQTPPSQPLPMRQHASQCLPLT